MLGRKGAEGASRSCSRSNAGVSRGCMAENTGLWDRGSQHRSSSHSRAGPATCRHRHLGLAPSTLPPASVHSRPASLIRLVGLYICRRRLKLPQHPPFSRLGRHAYVQ